MESVKLGRGRQPADPSSPGKWRLKWCVFGGFLCYKTFFNHLHIPMCCENMSTYSVWIVIMFFTLLFIYFNDLDVISSIVLMYLVL